MKDLLTVINEIRNVNEETDTKSESVNYEDLIKQIDKAFTDEAKYKITTERGQHTPNEVYKDANERQTNYIIVFGQKEPKGKLDNGAYLMLEIDIANNSDKGVAVYSKLAWSNGKMSYSIYSKAHVARRCELNFGKNAGHSLLANWAGGHDYYVCTPEVATNVISGICGLRYNKTTFEDAMKKARMTDKGWDKLVDEYKYIFKTPDSYFTKYHHLPWESNF